MTGRALTLAELDERRLELVDIKTQLRAIGRRKSVVETEILTGRVAPLKGVAAEQLPLVETATATTPATTAPEAPAQAPEAAKPATATATARTAVQQREAVLAALRAAKGRRSGKVLATLLGESEQDVHECLMELIQRGEARSARRGGYEATDKPQPPSRDVKPGKGRKPLWKPGYKPGILPSLTPEGNRRVLEMIAAAPGKKMLTSVVRAALDLPDDCCTPNGCYYQGSQAGGDWWGIRDDGAAPPRAKKPTGKAPAAKKAKGPAKGKKASKAEAPAPPPAAPAAAPVPQASRQELLRKAILDELGHGLATFGELLTTCMRDLAWTSQHMPQTTEVRDVLRALCEEGKVVWDEKKKVYHLPPPPPPEPKKKSKKASAKAEPTPAPAKAEPTPAPAIDWRQERKSAVAHIAEQHKAELPIGGDHPGTPRAEVLRYLEAAGALALGSMGWDYELSCDIDDKRVSEGVWRMGLDYLLDTIEENAEANGGVGPTAANLAELLEIPRGLVDDLVAELLDLKRLFEVSRTIGVSRFKVLPSPKGKKLPAQARTAPLFADVEPAPAVDGLEPEGDES